jgi:hypothetical protein
VQVGRREPKDSVARTNQGVLPAVVGDQAVAMIAAVELDHEVNRRIVQVSSADKPTVAAVQVSLHLGDW